MARTFQTVNDLVDAIRAQLDETNTDSVSDSSDILPALSRAQDYASSILARYYPEPLLTHTAITLTGGTNEYDIPEDAYEDRLLKVEISIGGTYREVQRASFDDIAPFEMASTTIVPTYYAIIGRKYRLVPAPDGTYQARIWYLKQPDQPVLQQGRVVVLNPAGNYVVVDSIGTDLSTVSDNLASYVNVVDGQTGIIKKSLQIQSITGNKITFRSSPLRTSVLGRTISSSFAAADVERDDYICLVQGTCVVQPLGSTVTNFLIQYTIGEITRKLGGDAATEREMLDALERQVQRTYKGREPTFRVRKGNRIWSVNNTRWWWPGSTG